MTTQTKIFNAGEYIDQLKRCDIETISHLEKALNEDLTVNELCQVCRRLKTNCGGIVRAVAIELGIISKP